MRKSKFTDEQIAFALKQAELGTRAKMVTPVVAECSSSSPKGL